MKQAIIDAIGLLTFVSLMYFMAILTFGGF